ncbi:hypothetical protein [Candidatus Nitrosotenuis cloacae]|uniref:Uncharacterized protein n=1 Tax=Candidatus Nitrosotenuis cloacae TaxID=1603555 RepID=A0A3G1B5J3_9ARCH|nr:hypothetical protein [Candidatus Nitrosotenuis cloacae]AJZ75303.1 hypothetical protein SU86_001640 [Candidatus Nitrosotenuis cloacae]
MKHSIKTKIAIISGIGIITFVASLVGLPFFEANNNIQKTTQSSIKKVESSEEKLLDVIAQEKAELEWKIGGKLKP